MAFLHFPKRWLTQPQQQTEVDWSHPLAAKMICAVDFRGPVVTQRRYVKPEIFGHAIAMKAGRNGAGLGFNGSSDAIALSTSTGAYFADQNAVTFIVATRPNTAASTITMMTTNDGVGASGAQFRFNNGGLSFVDGGVVEILNVASAITANDECVVGVTYDGTVANGFKNGVKIGTGSSAQTLAHTRSTIGQRGGGTEWYDGTIFGIWTVSGAATVEEMVEFTKNPWQVYRSVRRRVFVNTTAAAGGTNRIFFPNSLSGVGSGGVFLGDRLQ